MRAIIEIDDKKGEIALNQILVTEKLYVTPELKRKRTFYKAHFFLSVFLVCVLFSFYIYAEYDKTKSEEVSKEILSDVSFYITDKTVNTDDTTIRLQDDAIMVVLSSEELEENERQEEIRISELIAEQERQSEEAIMNDVRYSEGEPYYTVAVVTIPKINVEYPVLSRTSDALLKISPTRFWGKKEDKGVNDANMVGNFCIVGHNYRNSYFFSKVPTLENGDILYLKDMSGQTVTYELYDKYEVTPDDVSCTSQYTNGRREVTLITCTNDSQRRVIAKFKEVM